MSNEQYFANSIERFLTAYIQAALWSSDDDDGEPLDYLDADDIDGETLEAMADDCADFLKENAALLIRSAANPDQHGHDFWMTRNGHGAGFWHRGYGEIGRTLGDLAESHGPVELYLGDDGRVYQQ